MVVSIFRPYLSPSERVKRKIFIIVIWTFWVSVYGQNIIFDVPKTSVNHFTLVLTLDHIFVFFPI